jgi:hypothetical protein
VRCRRIDQFRNCFIVNVNDTVELPRGEVVITSVITPHPHQSTVKGSIRIGETVYVCVYAAMRWNDSGVDVVCGQSFSFSVPLSEQWMDWKRPCGANGYHSTRLIRPWEALRRVPKANWFQLIATVGRSLESAAVIGTKLSQFLPPFPGRLYLFANDLPWMYWNNRGMIAVRITRTR